MHANSLRQTISAHFQPTTAGVAMLNYLVCDRVVRLSVALLLSAALMGFAFGAKTPSAPQSRFTVLQIKSYPFPNQLTASSTSGRIAWAFNEQGKRNVWVAEPPDF